MIVGIQDEILRLHSMGLLKHLLKDKTTRGNIIWATDAYSEERSRDGGADYGRDKEIRPELITGINSGVIKTRARKALEQQNARTRRRAEVFTPLWICESMTDYADRETRADETQKYIDARYLEITCGEAPFLVSRYDASTGESIPIENRIGILDRKLRAVEKAVNDENERLGLIYRALRSVYGYELQGDNLLIARVNILMTFEEYFRRITRRRPTANELRKAANIIAWNIWQMDGLTGAVPYRKAETNRQITLFDDETEEEHIQPNCKIFDWRKGESIEFLRLKEKGKEIMKFDFIIGNPPYQEEVENNGRSNPIYNKFMDAYYELSDKVELITPARFLFNAGQTPKAWNEKMLNDEHLKITYYEQDSSKVFPNTDIKGGVAITLRDTKKDYGAIKVFTPHEQLNSIIKKVIHIETAPENYLDTIVSSRGQYRFSDDFYKDYPEASSFVGSGTGNMIVSNIFDKLSDVFSETPIKEDELKILGRTSNKRVYKYIKKEYVQNNPYMMTYNVCYPEATGTGTFGEATGISVLSPPLCGATDTFISLGTFNTEEEAQALSKYLKTKFLRTMLGIKKVTQHNPRSVWAYVPLQDFTASSDIDWSQPISGIDKQLYRKYGLDESEVEFIEEKVKEME